jgi:hypothetical protein
MAGTIKLNYEIANAEAASSASKEKYLIVTNPNDEVKEFFIPKSLAKKYTRVHLSEPNK